MHRAIQRLGRLPAPLFVAINVSATTLRRSDYADLVTDAIRSFGVAPERLHIEVTETALLNIDVQVSESIRRLADIGVAWYVDDFGTGYSSISHLRDLPISGLKLDQSFTSGLGAGDSTCINLADALAGLADGLGLDTVAEGVETRHEAALLSAQGWRHGQGWLYGHPEPDIGV